MLTLLSLVALAYINVIKIPSTVLDCLVVDIHVVCSKSFDCYYIYCGKQKLIVITQVFPFKKGLLTSNYVVLNRK